MPTAHSDAITHLRAHDPVIAELIDRFPKPTFQPHQNYYQELVESIISQQLSVKAAAAILKKFQALFDSNHFPTPHDILTKDIETFRSAGLSRQKASYILDLADKVIDGTVQFDHLDALDNEAIISELTQIKGVGVWTVHMFLIFCMGRQDVLPSGDLGIKNGVRALYAPDQLPSAELVETIAEQNNWQPYASVASWYIWKSLDNEPVIS